MTPLGDEWIVGRAGVLVAEPDDAEGHFAAALANPAATGGPSNGRRSPSTRGVAAAARPLLGAALEVFEGLAVRPRAERTRAELRDVLPESME
ncbi:hypothetical protein AB0D57_37435 [Streptomyces sp. NPDC048275]|uniref:hypothetical protein n=1 Tax=Streptomyces sp. NPDC048275 TaxID=3155629 RepID=UPI0033F8599B